MRLLPIALGLALLLGGCTDILRSQVKLQAFAVSLTDEASPQETGTPESPLPFVSGSACATTAVCPPGEECRDGRCSRCYRLDVRAMDTKAEPIGFSSLLHVAVTPGFVSGSTEYFDMTDGAAEGVEVCVNRASGATHLWIEHDGMVPRPDDVNYGQCNDGLDNDDNGLIDLADPGCLGVQDNLEARSTGVSGVSEQLFFSNPRIHEVQQTTLVRTSPLRGLQVRVEEGEMIVTNVVANGFYATDMARLSAGEPYSSIFIFTFSVPEGVILNDRLLYFSGAVEEHVGQTQVVFPSFAVERQDVWPVEPAAGGKDLTEELLEERDNFDSGPVGTNSQMLEGYEGALVKLRNIKVPTRLISCDRNNKGSIDDGDEFLCRNQCNDDLECTDLESFFEFGQWLGPVDGRKRMGFSVQLAAEFTPLDIEFLGQEDKRGECTKEVTPLGFLQYRCPARTVSSITGSLRHVYLCGSTGSNTCGLQFWILDPRFDEDVVTGDAP
jgi:hypothetical protein